MIKLLKAMGNCVSDVVNKDILQNNSRSSVNSSHSNTTVESFRVYIHRRNKFYHAWLRVSTDDISVERSKSDVAVFPLQYLRRYGYTSAGVFFFESGRRCETGEGLHTFQTQHADAIFRLVQTRVQDTADAVHAEASMRNQNRVNRESSLGMTEHIPRIHPVQRYSSEGNTNVSTTPDFTPNYHSLHAGEARRRKVILPPPPRPRSLPGADDHKTLLVPQGHAQIIGNIISENTVCSNSRKSSVADMWSTNLMGHSYANMPLNNNFEQMPYRPRCPSACSAQSTISSHSYPGTLPSTPTTKVFPMQWDGGAGSTSFLCYANTTPATRTENSGGKYFNMQDITRCRSRCLTIPSSNMGIPIDERLTPSPSSQLNYAAVDVLSPEQRAPSRCSTLNGYGDGSSLLDYSLIDTEKTKALQQARDDRKNGRSDGIRKLTMP